MPAVSVATNIKTFTKSDNSDSKLKQSTRLILINFITNTTQIRGFNFQFLLKSTFNFILGKMFIIKLFIINIII